MDAETGHFTSIKPTAFTVYKENNQIVGGGFSVESLDVESLEGGKKRFFENLAIPLGLFTQSPNYKYHDNHSTEALHFAYPHQLGGGNNDDETISIDETLHEKLIGGDSHTPSHHKKTRRSSKVSLKKGTRKHK